MSMKTLHSDWTCLGLRHGLLHGDRNIREEFTWCSMQPMH